MSDVSIPVKAAVRRRLTWLPQNLHPAQLVVLSFAAVIALGTTVLASPAATANGEPLRPIDAFFTAVSATCVTGLTVVDTATRFSTLGQVAILICIQIGGLGLMTLTTVFMLATGKRMAIADRLAIQESFYHSPTGKLGPLILYIVASTLLTEAVAAGALAWWWLRTGLHTDLGAALYSAVFHSVSAFCNAGFSLHSENAIRFQSDPFVIAVFSFLIISGGLGFLVGLDVKEYVQQRYLRQFWPERVRQRVEAIRPRPRISLHTKFVLTTTAALLLIGTISYYGLERNGVLREMSAPVAWMNAWFCSVVARTAGFNTIDYAQLGGPALLCTMVLMFIGASPGSTGGGVKTSTFGLLVTHALYRWRGHSGPHAFRRSIPPDTIERATAVTISAVAVIILASSFLMAAEARTPTASESQARFLPVMFETFSAFATVGLSMNYTAGMTDVGKIVVAAVMFLGRIGPLTVALAAGRRTKRQKFTYAEENVMVG